MMEKDHDNSDDSDDDDDTLNNDGKKDYCHFNDNGNVKEFTISLFGHSITLHQDPSVSNSHGFIVWEASCLVGKYLETNPKRFSSTVLRNSSCIELGSGPGIGGIAMMMRGVKVTLSDVAEVVPLTRINARKIYHEIFTTGVYHEPIIETIDWTSSDEVQRMSMRGAPYDICLLTDCVFSQSLAKPLVDTIVRTMGNKSIVLCCYEIRDVDANNVFLHELSKVIKWKRVPYKSMHPDYKSSMIHIITGKLLRT